MEKIIGLKEFRENTGNYIKAVQAGQSILVVKRSKPIFKLVSPESEEVWETVADFTKISRTGVELDQILARL